MIDLNGIPTITPQAATPQGTTIARVPITLEAGHDAFELTLREPGIVRGCTFWLHTPKVLASAMRGMQPVPMPMLFVECKTDGEMRRHRFVFAPSDSVLPSREGHRLTYLATATLMSNSGILSAHLWEIEEAPAAIASFTTGPNCNCGDIGPHRDGDPGCEIGKAGGR